MKRQLTELIANDVAEFCELIESNLNPNGRNQIAAIDCIRINVSSIAPRVIREGSRNDFQSRSIWLRSLLAVLALAVVSETSKP